ncbi:MAG TPA: hypothetical protein VFE98_04855 [Candidatus Bathyarchaeia archaeon]|nr:hypothetical protein [Candidatus Bathyarchaeia archaeon]
MAEGLYTIYLATTTGICLVNLLLLGVLAWFYHRGYKQVGSRFALGLLAFAGFLAAQNILYIGFYMMNFQVFEEAAPYVIVANGAQTLGLVTLTMISWK